MTQPESILKQLFSVCLGRLGTQEMAELGHLILRSFKISLDVYQTWTPSMTSVFDQNVIHQHV